MVRKQCGYTPKTNDYDDGNYFYYNVYIFHWRWIERVDMMYTLFAFDTDIKIFQDFDTMMRFKYKEQRKRKIL